MAKVGEKKNARATMVSTDDLFRLLVGIVYIDVPDMYSKKNECQPTSTEFVYRSIRNELCYINKHEMLKFSYKFMTLKEAYHKNE